LNQRVRVREPFNGRTVGTGDVMEAFAKISADFTEWRAENDRRLAAIEASVEDESKRTAAVRITGGGKPVAGGYRNDPQARAFTRWLQTGDEQAAARVLTQINAALSSDVGPEGGFLVPDVLDGRIGDLLRNEGVQRRNATVIPNAPRNWGKLVKTGYSTTRKVGEHTTPVQSQGPSWSLISPPTGTYEAMPAVTQQLLADATFDLERDVLADIATGMSELENVDFIRGTGVNEPMGWLCPTLPGGVSRITSEADKVRAYGKVQYIPTGDAAGFVAASTTVSPSDCLVTMLHSLKTGYRSNARWVMNSLTAGVVRRWKDNDGKPLWTDSIAEDAPPLLLGRPVDFDEDMDDIGANKFPIALGDWSRAYLITDIRDTITLRDPFTTKPYVLFFVRKSIGGMPMDTNAYKVLKVATS